MPRRTEKRQDHPNHLKDLILLFSIPLGIAAFAAIAVYLPRLLANPGYDFIYTACESYSCSDDYGVDDSGLVTRLEVKQTYLERVSTLKYYSAADNSTRSLSLDEARKFQLNTSSKSPDGYSLTREEHESGFLLWGDYDSGWYLKNGPKKKEVELSSSGSYYSRNVKFLGWINK